MLMKKRAAAIAAGAVLAAVVVAALIMWPDGQNTAPAEPKSQKPVAASAPFPPFPTPPPAEPPPPAVRGEPDPAAVEEGRPALCVGCLSERAVLDVVETYLRHLDPGHLQGGIWAQPLADVAPEEPGMVHGLPKLPPGLLEAPEFNPFGMTVDTRRYPVETTWLVWLQKGWVPRRAIEQRIRRVRDTPDGEIFLGDLPEVALSWPPIKKEVFVAVDGRTGEISPDGIFHLTSIGVQPEPPPHHARALELAQERADHWFAKNRSADTPP